MKQKSSSNSIIKGMSFQMKKGEKLEDPIKKEPKIEITK